MARQDIVKFNDAIHNFQSHFTAVLITTYFLYIVWSSLLILQKIIAKKLKSYNIVQDNARQHKIYYWVINVLRFWIWFITNREAKYEFLNSNVLIGSCNSSDSAVKWSVQHYIHSWPNKTAHLPVQYISIKVNDAHKMPTAVFKKKAFFPFC
jgi:hypothetical protein